MQKTQGSAFKSDGFEQRWRAALDKLRESKSFDNWQETYRYIASREYLR